MPGVAVVTDRTADLPPEPARRQGITVVPLTVGFGDDRLRTGVDFDGDGFLDRLPPSPALPTTSPPSPGPRAMSPPSARSSPPTPDPV